jgi:hypothetical protein
MAEVPCYLAENEASNAPFRLPTSREPGYEARIEPFAGSQSRFRCQTTLSDPPALQLLWATARVLVFHVLDFES